MITKEFVKKLFDSGNITYFTTSEMLTTVTFDLSEDIELNMWGLDEHLIYSTTYRNNHIGFSLRNSAIEKLMSHWRFK